MVEDTTSEELLKMLLFQPFHLMYLWKNVFFELSKYGVQYLFFHIVLSE